MNIKLTVFFCVTAMSKWSLIRDLLVGGLTIDSYVVYIIANVNILSG